MAVDIHCEGLDSALLLSQLLDTSTVRNVLYGKECYAQKMHAELMPMNLDAKLY